MEKEIIKIIESYFDNYIGLREGHRAINKSDLPNIASEIANLKEWYTPEYLPPVIRLTESITILSVTVINQSWERVLYDFLDEEWFSADNPSRLAHVEKWKYPKPITKTKFNNIW